MHYKVFGEGPVVLFLHGFLESMSMWDYLPLKDFRCKKVFIDLPGHGNSKILNNAEPSIESMANEVILILKKEKIKKFHIVGHSMGGYIALSIKEKYKECKKVILLNSNYWSDSESKKKDRDRVCKIAFKAKDYFLNEAIPNLFTDKV
ncbi:MAG: alpha/beta fold hydrolase, partial [Crocinitomicaceae bacterium]